MGTIFAHDQKVYQRWRRRSVPKAAKPMSDDALVAAIMRLGETFPDNVIRGTA